MSSSRLRMTIYGIFILSVILLTAYGCYTSFSHPSVQDYRWGDVAIGDDCSECHQESVYSTPILPSAAESDMNWQFYSGSPWWQDEMVMTDVDGAESYEGTGARHVESGASYSTPAVSPVTAPAVQTLGKSDMQDSSDSSAGQDAIDSRRSEERRTDTSSERQDTIDSRRSVERRTDTSSENSDDDATRTRRK